MAKKRDFSNTQQFSNRKSFDGKPVEDGKVLAPFRKTTMKLPEGTYIQANFTTANYGVTKFEIGFMPILESEFSSYMRDYEDEIEAELEVMREGRCIIGYKNGSPVICSRYHKCKDCPNKGKLERHNPNRVEVLSLDFEFENNGFDYVDENQPSLEDQVLERLEPEPALSEDKLEAKMLAHFDQVKPRYASIIRMKKQGYTDSQIIRELDLGKSRGYQEIDNAYNAACDFLKLGHMKNKKK